MRSTLRSAPLPARLRRSSWATCLYLLLCLAGCGTPAATTRPIDPPPAALAAPCAAGPAYPAASAPLREVLDVVAAREGAAADCRARHAALVSAWPK